MDFAGAEEHYHDLEERFKRGELAEHEFLLQVTQLDVLDEQGHRWQISPLSGRWLMHGEEGWVFAQPPGVEVEAAAGPEEPAKEEAAAAAAPPEEKVGSAGERLIEGAEGAPAKGSTPGGQAGKPVLQAIPAKASTPAGQAGKPVLQEKLTQRRPASRRRMAIVLALLALVCIAAVVVPAGILWHRSAQRAGLATASVADVALYQTNTPGPAVSSPTTTSTRKPSSTPASTATARSTDTPVPSATATAVPPTPTQTRTPSPTPTPIPTKTPTPTSVKTYTVQRGDVLSLIAENFGVSLEALIAANPDRNPSLIHAGDVLIIPAAGTGSSMVPATATVTAAPPGAQTAAPTAPATALPPATSPPRPAALSGKIAFTVWNPYLGTGKYELYVSLPDGSGRNKLGEGLRQPQFRQDGQMIAVNGDANPQFEHLDIIDPNGANLKEISAYAEDSSPTWAPTGNAVAYSSTSWPGHGALLGIVTDLNARQQHFLRLDNSPLANREIKGDHPFWLADGQLVYHGCDFWGGGGGCGLYLESSNGGTPRPLTNDSSDTAPAGFQARVAFMSNRDGNWEIYVIGEDGTGLKRLTKNGANDGLPTWSPDGKSIAFVSDRSGAWAIWAMNADGSSQRRLFDLQGGYGSGPYGWTEERISWGP